MAPPAAKKSKDESEAANSTAAGSPEHPAVTLFRDYIRIKSVQPDPDYDGCIVFLRKLADAMELPHQTLELVKGKPIMVITWEGQEPELPSILLNSHMDVVPVYPESWKYDPFAAVKEDNGDIYGRGTQDMKCVTIQHLEAVRRLKEAGKQFKRTIHLSFVPDEEIGGKQGMGKFVRSQEFKKLNVGLSLDEGLASPDNTVPLYYGERNVFWLKFTCTGKPGHGSRFIENTAAEKAHSIMDKLLGFRAEQKKLFESDPDLNLGDVTTVNLTMMSGGVQMNVVPNEFVLGFDLRITPTTNLKEFEAMLDKWVKEAGGGITMEFLSKFTDQTLTSVGEQDPWFRAFKSATDKHRLELAPLIFPANTDSRYIREVGIPALGFSPMNHTPVLLHDHNEFLNERVFLKGIDVFCDIISSVAEV